jgi:hypothetical protein
MIKIIISLFLIFIFHCKYKTEAPKEDLDFKLFKDTDLDNNYKKIKRFDEFKIYDGKVFYFDEVISSADPKSFLALDSNYGKDNKNVYYCDRSSELKYPFITFQFEDSYQIKKIKADSKSFEALGNGFAKDNKNAFYDGQIFSVKDIKSFKTFQEEINSPIALDKFKVYFKNIIVPNADPNSIQLTNHSDYIKDKNSVWYIIDTYSEKYKIRIKKLKNANPESFLVLENGYSKDKKNVYYEGILLEGSIASEFKFIEGGNAYYAKDKQFAYYQSKRIENANPNHFIILNEENGNYAKDEERVFFKGKEIVNANPETFIILEENYSKDNVNVYFQNKMIEDANPKTFQLLKPSHMGKCDNLNGELYAKDNRYVFFGLTKLKEVDLDTIAVDSTFCFKAHDKNRYFIGAEVDKGSINR